MRSAPFRETAVDIAYEEAIPASVLADRSVVALIRFDAPERGDDDPRACPVPLRLLDKPGMVEVWRSTLPVTSGVAEGIAFACNEAMLFAHLRVDEARFSGLAAATFSAYRALCARARQQGYPHLCRVWNYFPGITREQGGMERYRGFCRGRYLALRRELGAFEPRLPAACAIGTAVPGLVVCLLATRIAGIQIENPRQISAFQYPAIYSPKSPSFSRSVLVSWDGKRDDLFVSGTASIVGHRTQHAGDPSAQAVETLENLAALTKAAGARTGRVLRWSSLKVYVRRAGDAATVRNLIASRLGVSIPLLILKGDMCRHDLLLEIEGHAVGRR